MWNKLWGVAIATSLLVLLTQLPSIQAQNLEIAPQNQESPAISPELSSSLPSPQVHPLPPSLVKWQDITDVGDYFAEVKPTPIGYLIWSQFPVKIYVEQPQNPTESPASRQRFQNWVQAVLQAVQEWSVYLPLEVVNQTEGADITILRSRPPLRTSIDPKTGRFNNIRARSAEARYKFYLRPSNSSSGKVLSHQFTIQLSPDQTVDYTLATARHEIGHALGIWGHSPLRTDTMYYSQVRNSPQISARDINTLKRIYQQPTRLGWSLPFVSPSNHP
jgi:predicted Zn-dependent protease